MKNVLNEAMGRCEEGGNVYNTYEAVLDMVTILFDEYDADLN